MLCFDGISAYIRAMDFEAAIATVDKLRMSCVLIPDAVLIALNGGQEKGRYNQRVIIRVNDRIEWQGGVVAYGEGYGYITLSKARMKELDVVVGEHVQVNLKRDASEYGHEFPVELHEIFRQDAEAKQRFEALTPGKQRTVIYYILQNKSSEKRIEKSLFYMENLKLAPKGKETIRMIFGKWD